MQSCFDYGRQQVSLAVREEFSVTLLSEPAVVSGAWADKKGVTFPAVSQGEYFASPSESDDSDAGSDIEQEFILAILNKERYKSDLENVKEK